MFTGDYASLKIPCSHEIWLKGHTKAITCLSLDKKGVHYFLLFNIETIIDFCFLRIGYCPEVMIRIHDSGILIT